MASTMAGDRALLVRGARVVGSLESIRFAADGDKARAGSRIGSTSVDPRPATWHAFQGPVGAGADPSRNGRAVKYGVLNRRVARVSDHAEVVCQALEIECREPS